jgi:hypothetical protein
MDIDDRSIGIAEIQMIAGKQKKHKYGLKRRGSGLGAVMAVAAAVLMLFGIIAPRMVNAASSGGFDPKLMLNFENTSETEGFVNSVENSGADFFGEESRLQIENVSGSIAGNRSLRIANVDLRKGDVNIEDRQMRVGFSIKIGRNFQNEFRFMISTQDPATSTESTGGTLFIIKNDSDGNTFLYGSDNTRLFELKKDTVYRICAGFTRGRSDCSVTVNGDDEGVGFKFRSAVYCITGIRIYVPDVYEKGEPEEPSGTPDPGPAATPDTDAGTEAADGIDANGAAGGSGASGTPGTAQEDGANKVYESQITDAMTVLVDDIFISTKGRVYPQIYSIQEPGKLPEITVPEEADGSRVRVYVNTKEIDMSKTYVTDNTVYISAEQFLKSVSIDYTYDKNERLLTIANSKIRVSARVPGDEVTVNGVQIKLKYPVRTIDDVIMISPNFISEVFNAKVWWDKDAGMLVVTSGAQKNDGILRIVGDRFYMNGEPYYEISFNKYDLFYQLWAAYSGDPAYPSEEYREPAARAALAQLRDKGFKSVRVFCEADVPGLMYDAVTKGKYFETMDRMFDLCDEYGIKVVVCMGLISDNYVAKQRITGYGLVNKEETTLDLVADDSSESRALLGQYIREFVDRYKARSTVLMYEIVNEGNLGADVGNTLGKVCYSLGQLADFYNYCASVIRTVDGERVVTTGDSALRSSQYHLFASTMAGMTVDDWTTDDEDQRLYALTFLNYGTDVISAHTYDLGSRSSEAFCLKDGEQYYYGFDMLMSEAGRLGKPFYNGETGLTADPDSSGYIKKVRGYLDSIIDAGVQVSHWWTFRPDGQDTGSGTVLRTDSGEVLEAVAEANAALKSKYMVNGVEPELTNAAGWQAEDEIIDPDKIISGVQPIKETSNYDAVKWTVIIGAIMLSACCLVIVFFRLRIRRGN